MRPSPIVSEHAERVRTVTRHRRQLFVAAALSGLTAALAIFLGTGGERSSSPTVNLALARITGSSGGATGVAVSDSTLFTDARVFSRYGDTVSVLFVVGNEVQGIVHEVTWLLDSVGVSTIRLLNGQITPSSVAVGTLPEGETVIVCVNAEHSALALRLENERALDIPSTLGWLSGCDGSGAVVTQTDGTLGGIFLTSSGQEQTKLVEAKSFPHP